MSDSDVEAEWDEEEDQSTNSEEDESSSNEEDESSSSEEDESSSSEKDESSSSKKDESTMSDFERSMKAIKRRHAEQLDLRHAEDVEPSGSATDVSSRIKNNLFPWVNSIKPDYGDPKQLKKAQKKMLKVDKAYQLDRSREVQKDVNAQIATLRHATDDLMAALQFPISVPLSVKLASDLSRGSNVHFDEWTHEKVEVLLELREKVVELLNATQELQHAVANYAQTQQNIGDLIYKPAKK